MRLRRYKRKAGLVSMKSVCCFVLLLLTGCVVEGCRSKEAPKAGQGGAIKAGAALDPAMLGDVRGVVHFAGRAPAPVKIDTSMDPACGMGGDGDFNSEQYAVTDGKLANVYVYVKSGPPLVAGKAGSGAAAAVLDQKGCRYTPHVLAVMQGDPVEFRNSDATMHNIHTMPAVAGDEAIDVSQGPKGAPVVRVFKDAETMMPVRCNNHPWMNAFINVSATPLFAVSDGAGRFDLKGLPAGEYVLGAVHEKLGEQTLRVTVRPKGTAVGDFKFAMK